MTTLPIVRLVDDPQGPLADAADPLVARGPSPVADGRRDARFVRTDFHVSRHRGTPVRDARTRGLKDGTYRSTPGRERFKRRSRRALVGARRCLPRATRPPRA